MYNTLDLAKAASRREIYLSCQLGRCMWLRALDFGGRADNNAGPYSSRYVSFLPAIMAFFWPFFRRPGIFRSLPVL